MKPVIGIPQPGHDLFRQYMKSKYAASLRRAGAKVMWIELEDLEKATGKLLACDGLLLTGGGDIEPALYGQERHPKCGEPNPRRDEYEWAMLKAFLPTGKPVLGICRGVQMMNTVTGGTLLQDISGNCQCSHSDFPNRGRGVHQVSVLPGSLLARIMGPEPASVNSMHHQAADRLGEGMTVSARSEDGFIEAIELEGHPFCLGVQWHPEHMSRRHPRQQGLFDAFVAACAHPDRR